MTVIRRWTKTSRVWRHAAPYPVRDNLRHTRYCCHFARATRPASERPAEDRRCRRWCFDVGWSTVPDDKLMLALVHGRHPNCFVSTKSRAHVLPGHLSLCGYPPDLVSAVTAIVDGHDTHDGARSIEDAIVRDADKLWRYTPFGLETVRGWFGHSADEQLELLTEWRDRRFFTDAGRTMAVGLLAGLSAAGDVSGTASPASASERIVVPSDWQPGRTLRDLAARQRVIILVGLPGVGKSLLVQQLALMAQAEGRQVHLLQWDVTRAAFERPEILARFPEVDGVTHAAIRQAVGTWARGAVHAWHEAYSSDAHVLIVEPRSSAIDFVVDHHASRAVESPSEARTTRFCRATPSSTIQAARVRSIATHGTRDCRRRPI
jgi:hypothetical protein